jgi:hypothetical protein
MSILMSSDVTGFFGEVLGTALATQRVEASEGARQYLVGLLVAFAAKQERGTFDRPVTLLLDEALHAPASERFDKLKRLGDGSLYVSGLFQDHLEARGVDPLYVQRVGATAYGSAASLMTRGEGGPLDLLGELSAKFARFVAALHDVADAIFAGSAREPVGMLRVYERWMKTGSPLLERELAQHGVFPMKGGFC